MFVENIPKPLNSTRSPRFRACLISFRTTDTTLFREKIFCTDQEIDQMEDEYYNLNLDVYKTFNSFDNTYKVF